MSIWFPTKLYQLIQRDEIIAKNTEQTLIFPTWINISKTFANQRKWNFIFHTQKQKVNIHWLKNKNQTKFKLCQNETLPKKEVPKDSEISTSSNVVGCSDEQFFNKRIRLVLKVWSYRQQISFRFVSLSETIWKNLRIPSWLWQCRVFLNK